jgi:hypothetical protein
MEYIPYTYIVKNKTTGLFYYGVKISKRDANPALFWRRYFTSSKHIKRLVEHYGKEDFEWEIRKTFLDAESAVKWEQKVIRRIINQEKCINLNYGGCTVFSNEVRKVPDKNGLTSYQRAAAKVKNTRYTDVDKNGLNSYQRAYKKAVTSNPNLYKIRSEERARSMKEIGPDGLNSYQRIGKSRTGDNNPAKRQEVRDKISKANTGNIRSAEAIKKTNITRDLLGLNEKHSKRMTGEGNPYYNTVWMNNSREEKRIKPNNAVPEGYVLGRLQLTCPHCNKEGRGPNMKRYHFENCKHKDKE